MKNESDIIELTKLTKIEWYNSKPSYEEQGMNILNFCLDEKLIKRAKYSKYGAEQLSAFILLLNHLDRASTILSKSQTKNSISLLEELLISSLGYVKYEEFKDIFERLSAQNFNYMLNYHKDGIHERIEECVNLGIIDDVNIFNLTIPALIAELEELNLALSKLRLIFNDIGVSKLLADYLKVSEEDIMITKNEDNYLIVSYYVFIPDLEDGGLTGSLKAYSICSDSTGLTFSNYVERFRTKRVPLTEFDLKHKELYPEFYT